jgi:hypothetical protein
MREYHSPDPIILSVGEDEEVSIADVARHVAGKQLTTVLYCTVLYCIVLYCTVLYCTVLYCTVLYCTVLYCTVLYCTVLNESFL